MEPYEFKKAFDLYANLINEITPLTNVWQTDRQITPLIAGLARQVFEWLVHQAQRNGHITAYQQALQVVVKWPTEASGRLSGDLYLEAIQAVAENFEDQPELDKLLPAALVDYGIYWVEKKRWPVDNYVLVQAHENAGRLYDNIGMIHHAYAHTSIAHRKAIGDKKTHLSHRAHSLDQKRDKSSAAEEQLARRGQLATLLDFAEFRSLVNVEVFRSFVEEGKM